MRKSLDAKSITMLALLLVVAGLVVYMMLPISNFAKNSTARQSAAIEQVIHSAVLQCYALEGSYPPDIEYLSKHYGVLLDHSLYYYQYDIFASNIRPDITVTAKTPGK